jgi:3-oxoacyl-[acyl-carrier-protein] synthase II
VLGEGAAFLVLEEAGHAARRGACAVAEVVGWGGGSDGYHACSPHPQGRGVETAMRAALGSAGLAQDDVDLVVAAASSRVDTDAAEAAALAAVFGDLEPAVTAPAGALGWTHSAAGSFAAVAAVLALEAQKVPPTANTTTPDRDAPRGLVTGTQSRVARLRTALVNASALGGKSASAVFAEVAR